MSRFLDDNLVDRVRQASVNDIVEVISEHLSLQRKGKEYVGLCPFHQDSHPSMFVNPEKQIFKCFACGIGGDVFKFIQLRENITFPQALERLAERAGIKIEKRQKRDSAAENSGVDSGMLARVNSWALRFWQANYADQAKGEKARAYVEQRKIDPEMAMEWGLGFAPDDWQLLVQAAEKAGISQKLLIEAGLAVSRQNGGLYDKFRNRLMFPIVDTTGRVIGFGGRTLGDDPAKYMNSPATVLFDKSNALYGLDKARHEIVSKGKAVVVEGYTDVMMSHQYGVKNVVAALGTSFTTGHARLLRRFAREIIMVLDSDVAGVEAANRALEVCLTQNIDVKIASVPMGKDPCEFLLSSGKEAFEEILENASDVFEYKWSRVIENFNETVSITERKKAADEFLASVAKAINSGYLDEISKGLVIRRLSSLLGTSDANINKELTRITSRLGNSAFYTKESNRVVRVSMGDDYVSKAYNDIVQVLLCEHSLFDLVEDIVKPEEIPSKELRRICESIFEILASGDDFSLSKLISRFEEIEFSSLITDLADEGEKKGNYKRRLEDALSVINEKHKIDELEFAKRQINSDEGLRDVVSKMRNLHGDKNNKSNLRRGVMFN